MINKYDKSGVIYILTMFDPIYHVACKYLSKNVFWNPQLPKYISYEGHIFFESVKNSIYILEMEKSPLSYR